jgi:ribosome-associated heat shock protein Hsp15
MEDVRLDKWLWAARFFKTRALAADAVEGGKVDLNGEKPKRSKHVKVGDQLKLRLGPAEYLLTVRGVSERRGPAAAATALYEEDPEGRKRREALAEQHRLARAAFNFEEGKPSKKQRREITRFKRGD